MTDNKCRNVALRVTALFKVAVCMYYLAHGSCATKVVGDVASIGASTVDLYLSQFCQGVLAVLKPIYMPGTPPSELYIQRVRAEFATRRGIGQVALACDGTHVPYRGGPDYRNSKGWPSILALGFVNSFHLFVDADVGAAGRAGDNSVLHNSWLLEQIKQDPTNREQSSFSFCKCV